MSDLLDRTLGDSITVVTRDTSAAGCVRGDRLQLENAVLNLAVNARDAMDGRGVLTIATGAVTLTGGEIGNCTAGDYVTIAVGDTGSGMAPEIAERVFEPFFTTKEVGKGTGLGLSQIFALVRQAGGEIAIDTAPGEGTTVTLYLLRDAHAVHAAATPIERPAETVDAPSKLTILVVEDDPRVLAATTGALEELGHATIHLIVSDVLMPRQTGPEMIAALAPRYRDIAVLFVTGFAGDANAREFGGHDVLRKPFTLTGLERAVAAAVATDRPASTRQIAAE
jgi:CheY-like chemotaxis protein